MKAAHSNDTEDEFGNKIATSGSGDPGNKTFVGGLGVVDELADTGLHLMSQRWMDPTIGRFLNRDPIGYAGGLNMFSYAGDNPVNLIDPDGLNPGALVLGGLALTPAGWTAIGASIALTGIAAAGTHAYNNGDLDWVGRGLNEIGSRAAALPPPPAPYETALSLVDGVMNLADLIRPPKENVNRIPCASSDAFGSGRVVYNDPVSRVSLRGKSFNSGKKILIDLGLRLLKFHEKSGRAQASGRQIFVNRQGIIRVAFDREGRRSHWHKLDPQGAGRKLNNSGKWVDPDVGAAHIRSR